MTLKEYLQGSRDFSLNVLFVLPVLLIYEVGAWAMGPSIRNGADLLLGELFQLLGPFGMLVLNAIVIAGAAVCAFDAIHRFDRFGPRLVYLLVECLAYAAVLGPLVLLIKTPLANLSVGAMPPWLASIAERVVLAMGAGAYEELFFRLLVMGSLYHVALGIFQEVKWGAALFSLVVSSVFFALCHHDVILAGGEPFRPDVFLFRTIAGAVLGLVFYFRGFAAAVYTHAFYNLLVFFQR